MAPAIFQVLKSHVWLVVSLSARVDVEHVECGRTRLDGVRLGQNPGIWISASLAIALEKAMAPHSSTLAWKIPWMEEAGRLQSMGSLGVEHD